MIISLIRAFATAATCAGFLLLATSALGATDASDPSGDNCYSLNAMSACGIDFTTSRDSVGLDGSVHLMATFTGTVCQTTSYPDSTNQPGFILFSAGATSPADAAELGLVFAISGTTDYLWGAKGSPDWTPLSSTLSPGSVDVVLPAALVTTLGGPSFTWLATSSCRTNPSDPKYMYGDIAPNSGLYGVAVPTTPPPPTPTPDTTAPSVTRVVAPTTARLVSLIRNGYLASLTCSEACTVSAKLTYATPVRRRVVIGSGSSAIKAAGKLSVKTRLNAAGRALRKKKARAVKATLTLRVTDAAGNVSTKTRPVSVKLR